MKFVKMKDGHIYDVSFHNVEENLKDGLETELFVAHSGKSFGSYLQGLGAVSLTKVLSVNDVAKESDNIEELFDCYVDYHEGYNADFMRINRPVKRHGHEIYGAVWTDKGLIYVAKMNEKGEWALL